MLITIIRNLIITIWTIFPIYSIAQNGEDLIKIHKQSQIFLGHGIGNVWKTYLKQVINFPGITYKVTSIGPYTLIYEYGFSKRISGGIAAGYSRINGKYSGYGETYKDNLIIFSILARANYHLLFTEKWDIYAGAGAGYVNSRYNNSDAQSKADAPGEFGYSGQLGVRYLLKGPWGAYAEGGYVGGSFVQAGITVKFY